MCPPRQVVAARTYLLTRRCTQRSFFLRPDEHTNQIMLFCLAVLAERYGIIVHAYYVASNHHHLVVTDVRGDYPLFLRDLHSLTARAMNAHRGRRENLWTSTEQTSVVHLADADAVMSRLVYTLTNPVKDRLVARVSDWPGVCSYNAMLHDKTLRIERPKQFFRDDGELPDVAELRFEKPEQFAALTQDEWVAKVREAVQEVEHKHKREGRAIVGRKEVLAQSPEGRPATAPRRKPGRRVACGNESARVKWLQRNAYFQKQYRAALEAYRSGDRDVVFPFGTYQLVHDTHVTCHTHPPTSN